MKKIILKVCISLALFVFLFTKVDTKTLVETLGSVNSYYVLLSMGFIAVNYLISSIRWRRLLLPFGANTISVGYLSTLYFVGSFFNNFMPTSVGGDVYKVLKLGKKIENNTAAFTATFMERFLGVLALCVIAVFGFSQLIGSIILIYIGAGILAFVLGLKTVTLLSKRSGFILKVLDSFHSYKNDHGALISAFLLSFSIQLFSIFSQYLVFSSLGVELPLLYSLAMFPVITLASFFIPSLNGIGVQDALYLSLFINVGVENNAALSASILYHIFRLAVSLIGGILYAFNLDK